jgi:sugar-specific transcriptional regulator TrmB
LQLASWLARVCMSEETIKKVLREFVLTDRELEVYIFLARHQALKGGDIARGLGAYRAEVYHALKGLQSSGMVEKTLESPVQFVAVPFDKIIELHIKAKRREAALMKGKKRLAQ